MRIFVTGASSFTGLHLINALSKRDAFIWATATKSVNSYASLPKMRLKQVAEKACLLEGMSFGSDLFIQSILKTKPDILIHHGALTKGYRSPEFDVQAAVAQNAFELEATLEAFKAVGGRHVWLSGSIFQGESADSHTACRAFATPRHAVVGWLPSCASGSG